MSVIHDEKMRVLYASLMEEVKVRIDFINRALDGHAGYPALIKREFCYLQLRLLCELIGLACLVAHGDISTKYSGRIGREWNAKDIMAELEKLRPDFYPKAKKQTTFGFGSIRKIHHLSDIEPQPFPKTSLIELYHITNKYTHRGNLKNILKPDQHVNMEKDFFEIRSWVKCIAAHLSHHLISINKNQVMICGMSTTQLNNKVQVAIGESPKST